MKVDITTALEMWAKAIEAESWLVPDYLVADLREAKTEIERLREAREIDNHVSRGAHDDETD